MFCVATLAMTVAAQASTLTFTLNQDACTGTCGLSPFGTITLTDAGSGAGSYVLVTETLRSGDGFVKTGAGDALEFQLLSAATSLSDLTAGFSFTTGTQSASAFGSFSNGVSCSGCGNGASNPIYTPLSFRVNGVTTSDFVADGNLEYFASDILGSNGKTGDVAANSFTSLATPEPNTVVFMLGALLLLAGSRQAEVRGSLKATSSAANRHH